MGNNVLIVGPPHTGKLTIAQYVTKDFDCSTVSDHTHSGLVYQHLLRTKYFEANVNILIEEYPDSRVTESSSDDLIRHLTSFAAEFAKSDYKELRDELEGIVFTVDLQRWPVALLRTALEQFDCIKALFEDQELFYVVVGNAKDLVDEQVVEIEDEIMQFAFEFVDLSKSGENEFREKTGKDRLLELFESHDWSDFDSSTVASKGLLPDDFEQMTESLMDNEKLPFDKLLLRINAERERVKGLNDEEKERTVRAIVNDLMEHI